MKIKKFDVLKVPIEVEYIKPILGRLLGLFYWLMFVKVKKFKVTMSNQSVFSFYRLIIPHFLKDGEADAE